MRLRPGVVLMLALAFVLALTGIASAASSPVPTKPEASFLNKGREKQLDRRGAKGVRVPAEALNTECPGIQQDPGVSAGGCIVAPAGCTANYIFTDGSSQYVGTARHCVNRIGEPVVMQVDTSTITTVGTVSHMTSGEGEPGNDWALVRIDPAVASRWGVNPEVPVIGGPNGIYTGCGPVEFVWHYGHGFALAVGQGKPEAGAATNWYDDGFGWTGFGAPGDSGSPVNIATANQAVGDFTHLVVDPGAYPGSNQAGMRITEALARFAGISLVNANGSTSRETDSSCPADAPN